ncbi:type I restriction endonuclease subunit R [Magnetospirillum sp. SS-4]|uniref:type I restriction endonuclease subunit R n=1 Tax=Magnetospirillum sp. SS-4 TaxID=2681465 RepID=UPI0013841B57|nr:HsdR family type I site-specific deoxyribonuclease [Magnetospirillum sp. SS-4]CAA7627612.1 Type I site-specific deoxyribonuclease, HsdR family [Magnetospirillum sp. SS-4]
MTFTEANSVENLIRDLLCGKVLPHTAAEPGLARSGGRIAGLGWHYLAPAHVPRQPQEVMVEAWVRDALIRLNPEIAAIPDRADEVLYKLRAIVLSVRSDGLIKANEELTAWLRGDRSMPFGPNHQHTTVRLMDFEDIENNHFVVTSQFTFRAGPAERRADLVLLVNGLPLVLIEAKTPVRHAVSWLDGALQVHRDYEPNVPELFVANVFSVATEGKELKYGSIRMPVELWGPWRGDDETAPGTLAGVKAAVNGLLRPAVLLDILANFTLFATDSKKRRIKVVCRYQQYEAVNLIVQRVLAGAPRKGLIWHFQGSGKSLLMVFAAQKLRYQPQLGNPTVIIVVDRIDLDAQISSTFHASDVPNLVKAESCEDLTRLLVQGTRKIIITTIFKFEDAEGVLNERDNIIALVDEAHRTQEGNLGIKMRTALPNAFLFGLTGTPINRRDRNTYYAFGAPEDERGYMSRYGFEESVRDGATLELHFEPRLLDLRIDKAAIDQAFQTLTGDLSDLDRDNLGKTASKMAVLVKAPERVERICADITRHFLDTVAPNGFKGMVVTFDRECCLLYKEALDRLLPPEASEVVISVTGKEERFKPYDRSRDEEEKLLDRFRDPNDPLQILIVTAKLLTGFDAPILQAMYLDKPLRDHTLLQAICRTNRTYGNQKTHGLIVDYLGVFDDVAKALEFDETGFAKVVDNIRGLRDQLPEAMQKCLAFFPGVDRTQTGYEGLMAAQDCLPNNDVRDAFAAEYSVLGKLWEAISPDPMLAAFEADYRWLTQVYISVQPTSGTGKLIWHALGAKTIELIHQNIHVDAIRDDLDTLVLDAELLEAVMGSPDPKKRVKEFEAKVTARLRKHMGNPRYKRLSERLEALKDRHEKGLLNSVEFLKNLLDLARELVATEKDTPPEEDEDRGKAALTELFQQVRTEKTPVVVERIVADIDEIVRLVRFPGWQQTAAGEREVRKALRKSLLKYQLHQDTELFEQAYDYIRQYY